MSENEKVPANSVNITEREIDYAVKAIKSGWIAGTGGEFITKFEEKAAAYCGSKYGISTTSCSTALHLAVRAADIGPGDEVLVNTFTNIPSVLCVYYNGAKPVLVDSHPETWGMDESKIEEKITSRTKAIIPVHIYGHPVNMDEVMRIAKKHNLIVIEDAAEVFGATANGKHAGAIGDMGCFSFLGGKVLTAGEGGMVLTNNKNYADKLRSLKSLAFGSGLIDRYMHVDLGYNFRLSNVLAAIGTAQVERADELIALKQRMASWYREGLGKVKGLKLPAQMPWATNVYYVFGVLIEDGFGMSRDEVIEELQKRGIDARTFFVPMHDQKVFHKIGLFKNEKYPVADYLWEHGVLLPAGTTLTKEQVMRVCKAMEELSHSNKR